MASSSRTVRSVQQRDRRGRVGTAGCEVLKLRDVVDLRAHGNVRDALEDDLHDRRDAIRAYPGLRLRDGGLNVRRLEDADRLAAQALGHRYMVDSVAADFRRVDVFE